MKEVKTPIVQLISFVVMEHPVELQKMFHANNEWKIDTKPTKYGETKLTSFFYFLVVQSKKLR